MKGKKKYTKMCLILFNNGVGGSIKSFSSVVLRFEYDGRCMNLRFGCGGCIWEVVVFILWFEGDGDA